MHHRTILRFRAMLHLLVDDGDDDMTSPSLPTRAEGNLRPCHATDLVDRPLEERRPDPPSLFNDCSICLASLGFAAAPEPSKSFAEAADPPVTIPCGHVFHASCLMHALSVTAKCPLCRAAVEVAPVVLQMEASSLGRRDLATSHHDPPSDDTFIRRCISTAREQARLRRAAANAHVQEHEGATLALCKLERDRRVLTTCVQLQRYLAFDRQQHAAANIHHDEEVNWPDPPSTASISTRQPHGSSRTLTDGCGVQDDDQRTLTRVALAARRMVRAARNDCDAMMAKVAEERNLLLDWRRQLSNETDAYEAENVLVSARRAAAGSTSRRAGNAKRQRCVSEWLDRVPRHYDDDDDDSGDATKAGDSATIDPGVMTVEGAQDAAPCPPC